MKTNTLFDIGVEGAVNSLVVIERLTQADRLSRSRIDSGQRNIGNLDRSALIHTVYVFVMYERCAAEKFKLPFFKSQ